MRTKLETQLLAALESACSRMEAVSAGILVHKRNKGVSVATHVAHMAGHLEQHAKKARDVITVLTSREEAETRPQANEGQQTIRLLRAVLSDALTRNGVNGDAELSRAISNVLALTEPDHQEPANLRIQELEQLLVDCLPYVEYAHQREGCADTMRRLRSATANL